MRTVAAGHAVLDYPRSSSVRPISHGSSSCHAVIANTLNPEAAKATRWLDHNVDVLDRVVQSGVQIIVLLSGQWAAAEFSALGLPAAQGDRGSERDGGTQA